MAAQQRMVESDGHASVTIFNIENHRVPTEFTPAADNPDSAIACGHDSREVYGTDFEIPLHRNRLLHDGCR